MALLNFRRPAAEPDTGGLGAFLNGFSIEVMPRTAAAIPDFRPLLPAGTRVYVAHLDGTLIDDMVATARRLTDEGFVAMPHIPARSIPDRATLALWLRRYREEAGVAEALVLAGGISTPRGEFATSMDLLSTGLFDGFRRIHVAGHPEGSRDIDPSGGEREAMAALAWKQAYAERSDAKMAIATQFVFEAGPVIDWAGRIAAAGIELPVHVGIAGPAKLQTLLKFAIACGVGPSLRVLQKRARDVTKLIQPFEPTAVAAGLAAGSATAPNIAGLHVFPLGGIAASVAWTARHGARAAAAAPA